MGTLPDEEEVGNGCDAAVLTVGVEADDWRGATRLEKGSAGFASVVSNVTH